LSFQFVNPSSNPETLPTASPSKAPANRPAPPANSGLKLCFSKAARTEVVGITWRVDIVQISLATVAAAQRNQLIMAWTLSGIHVFHPPTNGPSEISLVL